MGCLNIVIAVAVGLVVEAMIGGSSLGILGLLAGYFTLKQLNKWKEERGEKSTEKAGETSTGDAEALRLIQTALRVEIRPDEGRCRKCQGFTRQRHVITLQNGRRHVDVTCKVCDVTETDAEFEAEFLRFVRSAVRLETRPLDGRCRQCQGLSRRQNEATFPENQRWLLIDCSACDAVEEAAMHAEIHGILVQTVRMEVRPYGSCSRCGGFTQWRSHCILTGGRHYFNQGCTNCDSEFAEVAEITPGGLKRTSFGTSAAGICLQCGENALWITTSTTLGDTVHEFDCSNCNPHSLSLRDPLIREGDG